MLWSFKLVHCYINWHTAYAKSSVAKTEFTWFDSLANMLKLSRDGCGLSVGDITIKPSAVVRDLVIVDAELAVKQHINSIPRNCFFQPCCISRLHCCIDYNTAIQLVCTA